MGLEFLLVDMNATSPKPVQLVFLFLYWKNFPI